MQKIRRKILFILLIITIISLNCVTTIAEPSQPVSITYKDFTAEQTLENEYSYGTLIWTDNTEIINLSGESDRIYVGLVGNVWSVAAYNGETVKFKITNCAIDKDGDMCDILVQIDNIKRFTNKSATSQSRMGKNWFGLTDEDDSIDIGVQVSKGIETSTDHSNAYTHIDCDLLKFSFLTDYAYANFHMTYYKHGREEFANVPNITSFIYDIDVSNITQEGVVNSYINEPLEGNEGIIPLRDSTIYYNKLDADTNFNFLTTEFGGISTPHTYYYGYEGTSHWGSTGITKATSAMVMQNTNAKFDMTYTGTGCGIHYVFVPAIPYEIGNPIKTTETQTVTEGEVFHYSIIQHIPNNYYTSLIDLGQDTGSLYLKLVILDQLDENLEIVETTQEKIKITNVKGEDCSSLFTINKEGNKITATATDVALTSQNFYNQTYIISVPVKVKTGSTKTTIPNKATVEADLKNVPTILNSNEVNVEVKYKVTLDVTVTNGNKVLSGDNVIVSKGDNNTFNVKIIPNEGYKITKITTDGVDADISNLTFEADGSYSFSITDENISRNIDHIVVAECEPKAAKVVTKHVDEEGNEIANKVEQSKRFFENYTTTPATINGYAVKTVPANASGTVDAEEIVVTYVYKPAEAKVITKYVDEDGKEIAPITEQGKKFFEEYETEKKNIEGYEIKTVPENAKGIVNKEEIIVIYEYKMVKDPTTSDENIPQTGKGLFIEIAIVIATVMLIITWSKYRQYKDIK